MNLAELKLILEVLEEVSPRYEYTGNCRFCDVAVYVQHKVNCDWLTAQTLVKQAIARLTTEGP